MDNVILTTGDIQRRYETIGPVYIQVSNKGLFASSLSELVNKYKNELSSARTKGIMSSERIDWGFLYGEWSVGQNDFERAFYVSCMELKTRAKMLGADAVIAMRQDIDLDTNAFQYFYLQMYGTAVRFVEESDEPESDKAISISANNCPAWFSITEGSIRYSISKGNFYLFLKGLASQNVTALDAKVSLFNVFGDPVMEKQIITSQIDYSDAHSGPGVAGREYSTVAMDLGSDSNINRTITNAKITVDRIIVDGEIIDSEAIREMKDGDLDLTDHIDTISQMQSINEITEYLARIGADNAYLKWIVMPRIRKMANETKVKLYLRTYVRKVETDEKEVEKFRLIEHLPVLQALDSAKEIYQYFVNLNSDDPYLNGEVLPEIDKKVASEKFFNCKASTIKMLEEMAASQQ